MALKAVHESVDDIPEVYRDLYTEKNGQYELTGIQGVKTQADIDRLQKSLHAAQADNKELKAKLKPWAQLGEFDEVQKNLDRIPELEAASEGKLDDAAIDEMVNKRVEGTINSRMKPVERELNKTKEDLATATEQLGLLTTEKLTREVHDEVRAALVEFKVLPEAHEDALLQADRIFEKREDDGAIVTKDGVGVTPGLDPTGWIGEIQEKKPHWFPGSRGTGAPGSRPNMGINGTNPFTHENWNVAEQTRLLKTKGAAYAEKLAAAAGTKLGIRPPPKKA